MAAFDQFLTGSGSLRQPRRVWDAERRVARRYGERRAPTPTPPPNFQRTLTIHSTAHDNNGGGSHRHPPSGVCGRESCQALGGRAPAPTRQLRFHQHQFTIHNLQNNNGGGSIRHPLSGVCGRESCQALWGGKGTRANTTTPASPTPIHHTQPSKQLWGRLNSTPTKWGVWKGELSGVVGREGHPRQHDHSSFTNTNPPYTTFKTIMGAAQFDTH